MISFPKPQVEQFFRTYALTNFAVSKDESRLVFNANLNGKMNLWALDLPGSFPYQFAHKDESCNFIKIDPENRFVLAGFDNDGDENYQIYALPAAGGLPEGLITGNPDEKYFFSHLSEDGNRVYYMTSEGNPNFLNTRVRDLDDDSDSLIHEGGTAPTYLAAVSDEEKAFVFTQSFANTYVTAFVKTEDGIRYVTPDKDKVHVVFNPVFTDEKTVHFITNFDSDDHYLAKYDLERDEFSKVLTVKKESITSIQWNKERQVFYMLTERGVTDALYSYSPADDSLTPLQLPVDTVDQIHTAKSGNLYVLGRSAAVPPNIFSSEEGSSWKSLTENRVLGVTEDDMVEPDVVHYTSFDGMEIEALLFRAKPENDNGHTIFWPHGGPQAAERKNFRAMFQSFLNRGYSVFAPNFRGSTGYGSEFVKLVEQDWGHGPRLDCVAGVEWLVANKITEPEKLFLVGGSYGGYMALLLHGRHPELFRAVIDIFGPSDLFTFVESVPPHWKPIMERWLGDPERDKERFIKDSPVTYLDGMTKPMLVIQGAKDPRVVKKESDQIVQKLRDKGREVEYLVLDDEGHGFSKKENEIKVIQTMLEFLEAHQA
ncbi:alpha/beta fold hydrolase [Sporosarcina trichiuri]|uniref:alpha/beta fold hydrolase n=1 Tax=Sporosarcina trichiuri TaxID=3056445 RepID=UPI0025B52BBC|nr:alpha/beta fold hydrolase [Sporosarcina sp. 0.2-SM1T-5]WJY26337.1 alpha/beta fold hydrolase [Sporosarcina sp. 0.2-SM1T-5]